MRIPRIRAPAGIPAGMPAVLFSTLIVSNCATASVTPVDHAAFEEVGAYDGTTLLGAAEEVLSGAHEMPLARSDLGYATLYLETAWVERPVFDDEAVAGAVASRSRVILRGQRRSGGRYDAALEGENQIRSDSIPAWHTIPVSPSFRAWLARIATQIRDRTAYSSEDATN